MLDARQFRQWLQLLDRDIRYLVPARGNPMIDESMHGDEAMYAVERELQRDGPHELPIRDEDYMALSVRAERALHRHAWAENPPARTRRIVSNLSASSPAEGQLAVTSYMVLHYSRHSEESCVYTGERRDILRGDTASGAWQILRREVILDFDLIIAPSLGLLF